MRNGIKSFNTGKIDEVLDLYDSKATIEFTGSVLGGAYKGKQGVGQFFQKVGETYPGGLRIKVKNMIESRSSVVFEWTAKGKLANGREVDSRDIHVFDVSKGKVVSHRGYIDAEPLAWAMGKL